MLKEHQGLEGNRKEQWIKQSYIARAKEYNKKDMFGVFPYHTLHFRPNLAQATTSRIGAFLTYRLSMVDGPTTTKNAMMVCTGFEPATKNHPGGVGNRAKLVIPLRQTEPY
jgi:hypothetical protein